MEDIKERYYSVCNRLIKARGVEEGEMVAFDAPHEVKRKMQVERKVSKIYCCVCCVVFVIDGAVACPEQGAGGRGRVVVC